MQLIYKLFIMADATENLKERRPRPLILSAPDPAPDPIYRLDPKLLTTPERLFNRWKITDQGLYLGNCCAADDVRVSSNDWLIVSFWRAEQDIAHIKHDTITHINIVFAEEQLFALADDQQWLPTFKETIYSTVSLIKQNLALEKKVLIHCFQGCNRSPGLVAYCLAPHYLQQGLSIADAFRAAYDHICAAKGCLTLSQADSGATGIQRDMQSLMIDIYKQKSESSKAEHLCA